MTSHHEVVSRAPFSQCSFTTQSFTMLSGLGTLLLIGIIAALLIMCEDGDELRKDDEEA